jgi:hypothetical protein
VNTDPTEAGRFGLLCVTLEQARVQKAQGHIEKKIEFFYEESFHATSFSIFVS